MEKGKVHIHYNKCTALGSCCNSSWKHGLGRGLANPFGLYPVCIIKMVIINAILSFSMKGAI